MLQKIASVLLAPSCLLCAEPGHAGLDLCAECTAALAWNTSPCFQCGLPMAGPGSHCGACQLNPPPYTRTQAPVLYRFPIDRLLPRFKFQHDLAAGALLGTLAGWALDPECPPQCLMPVPLHRSRLRQRGYDQALELARAFSRHSGVPLNAGRLRRRRATGAQSELGAAQRVGNVHGAFQVSAGPPLPAHVALVDDVMTTGATVAECARSLLAAGVARVDVWVVARAL